MGRVIFSGVMLFLIIILSGCEDYSQSQKAVSNPVTTQLVNDFVIQEEEAKEEVEEDVEMVEDVMKKSNSKCHSSYSGRCLKTNAGDYDCEGGSGNGPNYTGKVKVVGYDEFGLDRDKDGWGYE